MSTRHVVALVIFDLSGSAGLYLILVSIPQALAAFAASAAYIGAALHVVRAMLIWILGRAEFERLLLERSAGPHQDS